MYFNFGSFLTAILFLALGLAAFALLFRPFANLFLAPFRREIVEERNTALAVFAGFVLLSLSIIIAAAIH